ncbi:MAG TPA: GAF domain-containing sensor histidine kinase [Longimicrobium sp.]|jgi:signal transduction histidine kinase|uniref:GAF domain-containing sensor histidine kinase n=1 Tax=Longimicrobium sp. TaxID=2029185 RepID=UPI002ED7A736
MSNTLEQVIQNPERLRRLRATGLLDAPTDAAFDRLTRLAARLLSAPVSTVTLVDSDRQFYMACAGMPEPLATERQTPLEFSFCKHTVVLGRPLIIPDTRLEPIVAQNPSIAQFGVTSYAGIPLLTSDGHALGTLCVMDFQVRNWTEEEIGSLTDLAASVSTEIELRMDLAEHARVQQQLQNTVRLRDEVLGIVSHDLRNPVHTIQLSSGFLLETLPDEGSQALTRKQLGIIRRAAQRMDRMIGDLLDAATIAAGHLSMEPRPHSATLLLRAAFDSLAPLAQEKGIRFVCDGPDRAPAVMADVDRVIQVLGNLVGNAVRFTPEGGTITLGLRPLETAAEFRVADTGSGIPADQLARVFDQFWQARRDGRQGTGLGLTIAQGIVHAHGGEIRVESAPGEGTTFLFTLPYAEGTLPFAKE